MSNEEELKRKYLQDKQSFVDLIKNQDEDEDSDQNFIKKDEHFENVTQSQDVQDVVERLKNAIAPKNNQRRDLDLEVGGLESKEEAKELEDDMWDERSEQINDMVVDVFNTTSMKSLVWKKKKERLDIKKEIAEEGLSMSEKEMAKRLAKLKDSPGPGRGR